jgi:hypothetical protein
MLPEKRMERYIPRIFGFKLHSAMVEIREQENLKREQAEFLKANSVL